MGGNIESLKGHLMVLVPEYQGSVVASGREDDERTALVAAHAS